MSLYSKRGVSAQKEDVHQAIRNLDQGLYPYAFCKLYPDVLGGDKDWVNIMHADGAGTKSILAYLYWQETGDNSIWKGIAQDAIVMNLDDLLCVGICDNIAFSSTIDRNKHRIPGDVLQAIIEGSAEFLERLRNDGVNITYMGGETADVGDLVRTIAVNGTMSARWPKERLITNEKIKPGQVIVGLASFGQASYENSYNSGIGSNGLTSARHDVLHNSYGARFPESFEPLLEEQVSYIGSKKLLDKIHHTYNGIEHTSTIGELLLSPTRSFAPVMRKVLEVHFDEITGLIHCSGGGQTKCLKYLPAPMRIMKDNLFEPPIVFELIREQSGADTKEMYQVFNMGTRLEIYTDPETACSIIDLAKSFNVDAKVIGRIEEADRKELHVRHNSDLLEFSSDI